MVKRRPRHQLLKRSHFFGRIKRRRYRLSVKKKKTLLIAITALASLSLLLLLIGSVFFMVIFAYFSKDLPSPTRLQSREMELATKIFDRQGTLLYDIYGEKNRTLVRLDQVSPHLVNATLAVEDAEFFAHQGFDVPGVLRGFLNTLRGRGLQGGSTLTQQLVKNALLTPERTVIRKIKELVLSVQIERRYDKGDILQMYLNESPYGSTAWGVEAAAQLYFDKGAQDLTLAESALIAGLPQQPSYYSPFGPYPENAQARQSYVLKLMHERGWLDETGTRHHLSLEEYEAAKAETLNYALSSSGIKAPHFVMYIKGLLEQRYGEELVERGGLQVTTTLDYDLQESAEAILAEEVAKAAYLSVGNAALVAIDPQTGQILAMVGSKDYFNEEDDGNVNVTLSLRQPGSAIKPLTYATALKQGYTASTVLYDVPTTFPGGDQPDYKPKNYDDKFQGPVQVRNALGSSVNVAAVKMLKMVGIPSLLQTARDFGITSLTDPSRYGLSLTLGGGEVRLLELANAFAVFASGGTHYPPTSILKVTDAQGHTLEEWRPEAGESVLDPGIAYILSRILSDNNARLRAFGAQSLLNIPGKTVAVKTGTTNDIRDNWTVGYTPEIVIGVWAGNNDNSPMNKSLASGITGAAPIWNRVMADYLGDKADQGFVKPNNVVEMWVGTLSGMKPFSDEEDRRVEYFLKGTEPQAISEMFREIRYCKDQDKDLNECDDDDIKSRTYVIFKAELPEWQDFVDDWRDDAYDEDKDENKKYYPPDEEN